MIRHDEKEWVEEILATHEKPDKMTTYQLARYIAMYYFDEWHELKIGIFVNNVLGVMREFNFSYMDYQEWKFPDYIKRFCKRMISGKIRHELLDVKSVSITRKEMEIIKSAQTEKQQMLLFTFFVVAKISIAPSGWINYALRDVFECADIKVTKTERHKMIHDLYTQGLVRLNEFPDKRGYQVDLQDDIDDIVITITRFEHVGKQYLEYTREGWKMCDYCGRMIKIKAPNQKYCKKCAENIQKSKIKQWKLENSEKPLEAAI